MSDEVKPVQNTAERFKRWLQLLEAHGASQARQKQDLVPKPTCVHGSPWDECDTCLDSAAGEGQA